MCFKNDLIESFKNFIENKPDNITDDQAKLIRKIIENIF